jgi:hypothetical protein
MLSDPVAAYFVIPRRADRACAFAEQDNEGHLLKAITVPAQSEVIVDLVLFPKLPFTSSEIYVGCEGAGDVRARPYATEYFNRFIEVGSGRSIKPGEGSTHYIDRDHLYHIKEPMVWSVRSTRAIAFKMLTGEPGTYPFKLFFPGDAVEGVTADLLIRVEDCPTTRMHCVDPKHAHKPCAVGIAPKVSAGAPK